MRRIYLGPVLLRDQPVPSDRNVTDAGNVVAKALFPRGEVNGARIGRQHDELREGHAGTFGDVGGCLERRWPVTRKTEDEGSQHVDAMLAKRLQARDQRLADMIETLVD